jgi:hypothetical protein
LQTQRVDWHSVLSDELGGSAEISGARFIRVTGTNLENIARGRYNSEAGTMVLEKRPNFRGAA